MVSKLQVGFYEQGIFNSVLKHQQIYSDYHTHFINIFAADYAIARLDKGA
jgi:hypothetical protein